MRKEDILKEKEITNQYGVTTRYTLEKWYKVLPSGIEYNVEYVVRAYNVGGIGGYLRVYKKLANAIKDSYVEKYL